MYYPDPPPMQETRPTTNGGEGGGGNGGDINNNGTGLGIFSSSTNASYGGGDYRTSLDPMNARSMHTSGFSNRSSGFGYDNLESATALGVAGMYGYENAYRIQQQMQHQPQSHYPLTQPLSYTPPTEPEIAPEDRYDPNYAAQQEQEAAYMNYQQQQLYLQSQQQQQLQQQQYLASQGQSLLVPGVHPAGSYESRTSAYGGQDGYYPDQRLSVASADTMTYLDRLRGGLTPEIDQGPLGSVPEGVAGVVANARTPGPIVPQVGAGYSAARQQPEQPSIRQHGLYPSPPFADPTIAATTGTRDSMTRSEDYAYPESDARHVSSKYNWPSPPKPKLSTTTTAPVVTVAPHDQPAVVGNGATVAANTTLGELTPPVAANRFAEGEAVNNNDGLSPNRSSVLSQSRTSSSVASLNPKRLHPPQLIPSPKRAPQVLYPEDEPTNTTITRG
ncbi:hypothetical protein BGX29_005553 [Mortierella sp. GBA35]|nr:hypothetical protein BGX23_012014 [Mortierella sp. AD031]KAF9107624.1 hypothetical protein BGX29_005553 [Mortierella sp. GBA35]